MMANIPSHSVMGFVQKISHYLGGLSGTDEPDVQAMMGETHCKEYCLFLPGGGEYRELLQSFPIGK